MRSLSKLAFVAVAAASSVLALAATAGAVAGVRDCAVVRVSTAGGKAAFEATDLTTLGVSCRAARELADAVGRHVLLAADPPGGKYDACMLTSRICSAIGFSCHGQLKTRRPYALTERCTRGRAIVRWRELDFDYR